MKAKVAAAFRDRLSWRAYAPGDEYEGPDARVSELVAQGLVTCDGTAGGGLAALTVSDLKALCEERGVGHPKKATKAQLLALLGE